MEDYRRESEKELRTKREIYKIKAVRVLVNVIVLLCLFGGGFAIYKAVKWSMDVSNACTMLLISCAMRCQRNLWPKPDQEY